MSFKRANRVDWMGVTKSLISLKSINGHNNVCLDMLEEDGLVSDFLI